MIVALDLETTGVDKKNDKILEIALVKFDENTFEIIDIFTTLINPLIPIPEVISNITNIFDEDVKDAPIFDKNIVKKINEFVGDLPILGHNTYFDIDFLTNNNVYLEKNIILDTFVLANIFLFYEKSLNLGSLCEKFGISINSHRALNDVFGTIEIFKILSGKINKLSKEKKEVISFIFSKSNDKSFNFYKNYFNLGVNISIENFTKIILKRIGKYKEKEINLNNQYDFNNISIEEIFKSFLNFEIRQNQILMSKKIYQALNNNKKLVIEAPIGIGKTFAYLVPSIIFSLKFKKQVFISTSTKQLQDKIFYKDLEFLKNNLPYKFSFSKLKGKKNYLSVFRFLDYFSKNEVFNLEETVFFSKLSLWIFETDFGELDELNYYGKEFLLLNEVNSDDFLVLQEDNPYKYYEYIFKAKNNYKNSNIVIINHYLLIEDIISTQSIFGQIKNLIIDESHNLEDITTDVNIKQFSLQKLKDTINKILNKVKPPINNLDNKFGNIFSLINSVFCLFIDYLNKKNKSLNEVFQVLIEKDFFDNNKDILNLLNDIELFYIEILNLLQKTPDKIYLSLKDDIQTLEEILQILKVCLNKKSSSNYIPIFSIDKNGNSLLCFTILNIGNFLKEFLWNKIDNVILTSSTLKVNDNFNYIKSTLGLQDFDFESIENDFDYSSKNFLYIPNDLGTTKFNNPKVNDFIKNFLIIVGGKTLVLLTSFNSIKDLYLALNLDLKKLNINLLSQFISGSKFKIVNHFKKYFFNSVILGTNSFWEGIDIPEDNLKYLIIYKFPFLIPTDPIFKARSRLYKDSFIDYSLSKAIIKTKQRFGKFIKKNDAGIIILLDERIINTSWGTVIKNSFLKDINIKQESSIDFLNLIKNNLNK